MAPGPIPRQSVKVSNQLHPTTLFSFVSIFIFYLMKYVKQGFVVDIFCIFQKSIVDRQLFQRTEV